MKFDVAQLKQLNELDFEQVATWPHEVKWVVAIVTALFSLGLGWFLLVSPKLPLLDSASAEEATLKSQYQAKYRTAVNLSSYQEQLKQMQQDFAFMLKSLPTSNETPGLLDDITYVGTTSGLTFRLLQWQPEIEKEFYTELPIQLEVTGKYHDFGQFVTKIATLPRIVTLHDFALTNETEGLRLQMQARTYRTASEKEVVAL
ncbi:MAG: type 4a pilus biogenesis protein PilO [Glaciecola sp.]|nr:type 4a pilus biogenesis protein PilO [Glaciecola sp.]MDG2098375.1 type 4a pilus biogenesis protein PilO [Glaciecola sp.]